MSPAAEPGAPATAMHHRPLQTASLMAPPPEATVRHAPPAHGTPGTGAGGRGSGAGDAQRAAAAGITDGAATRGQAAPRTPRARNHSHRRAAFQRGVDQPAAITAPRWQEGARRLVRYLHRLASGDW